MEFLGGEEEESVGEVESHLVSEDAAGSCSGAVGLVCPVVADVAEKVEILFHFFDVFLSGEK